MRPRRLLAPGVGYYHVISRIAGQRFLMDAEGKFWGLSPKFEVAAGWWLW